MASVDEVLTPNHRAFLHVVRKMFSEPDYLIPYVWAQEQFRGNNYQMSANSQLEHMFEDTLSTFIQHRARDCNLTTGDRADKADYRFNELELSHKEAKSLTACLTFFWEPGTGEKHKVPIVETADFDHPVVLVYTPVKPRGQLTVPGANESQTRKSLSIEVRPLSAISFKMASQGSPQTRVVVGYFNENRSTFTIVKSWTKDKFEKVKLPAALNLLHDKLSNSDFLLITPKQKEGQQLESLLETQDLCELEYRDLEPPSGTYLLPVEWLRGLPVESNNKAHYATKEATLDLVRKANESGLRVPLPFWPSYYLVPERTDLFEQMQVKYRQVIRSLPPRFPTP